MLWQVASVKDTCKACGVSGGAKLRACSFCSTFYHDTTECLGEARPREASFAHVVYPWCCPSCFQRGKAAWGQKKLKPARPGLGKKRKGGRP